MRTLIGFSRARIVNEAKAFLLLDRFGQDVMLEKLPFAPSERNPKKILATCGAEGIAENADVKRACLNSAFRKVADRSR